MTQNELKQEVHAPTRRRLPVAAAIASTATAASLGLLLLTATMQSTLAVEVSAPGKDTVVVVPEPVAMLAAPAVAKEAAPTNAAFVFIAEAGGRRFALLQAMEAGVDLYGDADAKRHRPYSGAELLGNKEYPQGAVKKTGLYQMPPAVKSWKGKTLRVANRCETVVGDIVHVALVTGDADYAGVDDTSGDKVYDFLFGHGASYFAAELKECATGSWGQLSGSPLASLTDELKLPASLKQRARRDIIRSSAGREAAKSWKKNGYKGEWHANGEYGEPWTMKYVRHAKTGQHWLVALATVDYGCGGAAINILAVYKVDGKKLQRHYLDETETVLSISEILDIDSDGSPEIIGHTYLTGPALTSAKGEVVRELKIPFYGCPC